MLRIAAAVAALSIGATLVYAQNVDAIKQRREAMRTVAKAGSAPFKMIKGEAPFDLAPVQAALKNAQAQGAQMKNLFPDDSKTGGGTDALPTIWAKRAEFNAAVDNWVSIAKAAEAAIKDEASFKAEYPKFTSSCGGCHKATDGFAIGLGDSFKKLQSPL